MLLNIAFLLAVWPLTTSVPSTLEQPNATSTEVPVTEGLDSNGNETDNKTNVDALDMGYELPKIEDDYYREWHEKNGGYPDYMNKDYNWPQLNSDYRDYEDEGYGRHKMNYNYQGYRGKGYHTPQLNSDYPDYGGEEHNITEEFEEEWENAGQMEISLIGRYDPNSELDQRVMRKREIRNKDAVPNRRYRRAVRKPDRTKGCNKLPVAPDNTLGTCHHTDSVAKCWVVCHKFNRYPDSTRQKTFLCLYGSWEPKKLPDCKPQR